jgi:hypothetical protein
MRMNILGSAIVVGALLALVPKPARACGQGGNYGAYAAVGVGALVFGLTDVGMTIADLVMMPGLGTPSATYGGVELAVAAPQLLVGIYGLSRGGQSASFFAGYSIWMSALCAHGIWSIAAARAAARPAPGLPVPAPEPPDEATGVKMRFGPTYVPLGPLAQMGFGLSGRF